MIFAILYVYLGNHYGYQGGYKVKTRNILQSVLATSVLVISGLGCNKKSSDTAALVNASFKMTGSNSAATVANLQKPNWLDLLMPKAFALTPSVVIDASGSTVNLSQVFVVIKSIEFEAEESDVAGEVDGDEVEFQGPYVVDLLTNSPLVLDTQTITSKAIKRIKMQFHKAETLPASAPTLLQNHSILIQGSVGGRSFTYLADDSTEIQIAGPSSFVPSEGSQVLVELQLANMFKQINLASVTNGATISAGSRFAGTNLCPLIDSSAQDLYTCFRKALEKHADAGDDRDGNGDLGDIEDSVK